MKKIIKTSAISLASVLMSVGLVGAQSGSIDTTGPDSDNHIAYENSMDVDVSNDTDVDADVDIDQDADSGNAKVWHNTEGGSAESGSASNDSSVDADLEIDNSESSDISGLVGGGSGNGTASIDKTGPDSNNTVTFANEVAIDIDNDVDVDLDVDVDQDADSGDAWVSDNTEGGDATSGDASNTSSTSFSLVVRN